MGRRIRIGIAVRDIRLLSELLSMLHNFVPAADVRVYNGVGGLVADLDVLMVERGEFPDNVEGVNVVPVSLPLDVFKLVGDLARSAGRRPRSIIIGVDPGIRIGVIALLDGMPIFCATIRGSREAAEFIANIVMNVKGDAILRMGASERVALPEILRELSELIGGDRVAIEMVDEREASLISRTPPASLRNDELSAYKIALTRGRPVRLSEMKSLIRARDR